MRTLQSYFAAYSDHHRNPTNIVIHWICVPVIFFSVIGALASIPPAALPWLGSAPWAKLAIAIALLLFYLPRSIVMTFAMAVWSYLCLRLADYLGAHAPWPLWAICLALFSAAWIGQFYGHGIEGRKPSFLEDLAFLLVGPAWLMGKLIRRLGVTY